MKTATKISKSLGMMMLALSLIYCGGSGEEGTTGSTLEVQGQQIELLIPSISLTRVDDDITVTVEAIDSIYLSHVEIEKHTSNDPFAFLSDVFGSVYEDMDLANGSHKYRARAVYEVSGATYFSEYSDVVSKSIGVIADVPSEGIGVNGS